MQPLSEFSIREWRTDDALASGVCQFNVNIPAIRIGNRGGFVERVDNWRKKRCSSGFTCSWLQVLYDENVTRNVFCVNVDAVIATLLLKMLWRRYREGQFSERALETAAFTVFLYGRMLGCAAEIDDHLNRGKNMDTRTPQADIRFVA